MPSKSVKQYDTDKPDDKKAGNRKRVAEAMLKHKPKGKRY